MPPEEQVAGMVGIAILLRELTGAELRVAAGTTMGARAARRRLANSLVLEDGPPDASG